MIVDGSKIITDTYMVDEGRLKPMTNDACAKEVVQEMSLRKEVIGKGETVR